MHRDPWVLPAACPTPRGHPAKSSGRVQGPPGLACQHLNPASSERGGARVAHRREPAIRAAGRAQRDLDLRAHSRGALALGAGPPPAAAHAAHRVEPWSWNSTNVGTLARLPRCGRPGPLWRAPGPVRAAVRRRARRPAPPDPLAVYFCTNLVGTLGTSARRASYGSRARRSSHPEAGGPRRGAG